MVMIQYIKIEANYNMNHNLPISIPRESNDVTRRGCISLLRQLTTFFKWIDAILWSTISVGIISVVLLFAYRHGWKNELVYNCNGNMPDWFYISKFMRPHFILNIPVVVVGASVVSVIYKNCTSIIIIRTTKLNNVCHLLILFYYCYILFTKAWSRPLAMHGLHHRSLL